MKKKRRQKTIFSSIAGLAAEPLPNEPIPTIPSHASPVGPVEVQPPSAPQVIEAVSTPLTPPPAEVPKAAAPPPPLVAVIPPPMSPAAPEAVTTAAEAPQDLPDINPSVSPEPARAPEMEPRQTGETPMTIITPYDAGHVPPLSSLGISFVHISPGSFVMGSPEAEPGRQPDETQHEVRLSRGFYLQTTPVTQRQWQALMGVNPAKFSNRDDCPVENVSWDECQAFIRKLNESGEAVYRLPTETEWEYACRAGGAASLGDRVLTALFCERDPGLEAVAWYCGNSDKRSQSVALKNPNSWELYDMHGNVMEWCQDWYGEYPAGPTTDPTGAPAGVYKVIRGGSWFSSAKNCRAAFRAKLAPESRSPYLGFRLVQEIG